MTIHQMQAEILRLKQKQNVCILAHSYQAREILEIADFTGDSFQLSLKAASAPSPGCCCAASGLWRKR